MIFRKANLLSNLLRMAVLSAAAAAAMVITACEDSSTAPRAATSAEARADLQAMAGKVRYFAPQDPSAGMGGGIEKGAAGKAKAGAPVSSALCDVEAVSYDTWETDTSVAGGITIQYDTTVSYTAAGQPICDFDDVAAYEISSSRAENGMYVSQIRSRVDFPADFFAGEFKISGSGTVAYKDGYLITIQSINIVIDIGQGVLKAYSMNLALEKGYAVVLQAAPGNDPLGDEEPGPNEVAVSGPITKDGAVVGYFEVMGDDRVIIRDADRAIIEAHG